MLCHRSLPRRRCHVRFDRCPRWRPVTVGRWDFLSASASDTRVQSPPYRIGLVGFHLGPVFFSDGPIGEDQSIAFGNRVPGLAHLVPELAAIGFAGLFKAAAFGIELPAVIAAADAVLLDLAIIERGAAMAAAGVQQPDAAVLVAKQDQVLAERTH